MLVALGRILTDPVKTAGWIPWNGGSLLSRPAEKALKKAGVDLRLSSPVRSLRFDSGQWIATTREAPERFHRVIITVPPWAFNFVENTPETAALLQLAKSVQSRQIVTIRSTCSGIRELPGPLLADSTEEAVWFAEPVHGEDTILVEKVVSGLDTANRIDLETVKQKYMAELNHLFPEAKVCETPKVIPYPKATPALVPGMKRPLPRQKSGLYLAGDWCMTGLPATLEGAAVSGTAAAEALLEDTGNSHNTLRGEQPVSDEDR